MTLDGLFCQLNNLEVEFEQKDFEELTGEERRDKIILLLLEYIGHKRIEEKIDGLVF